MVAYMDKSVPEVRYNPAVAKDLVLVSVTALAEAFYRGLDQFLIDLFSDRKKAELADKRLGWLVQKYSTKNERRSNKGMQRIANELGSR